MHKMNRIYSTFLHRHEIYSPTEMLTSHRALGNLRIRFCRALHVYVSRMVDAKLDRRISHSSKLYLQIVVQLPASGTGASVGLIFYRAQGAPNVNMNM